MSLQVQPQAFQHTNVQLYGADYKDFRPKYPQSFLKKILGETKGRENYLDVCTGAGHLFFDLFSSFHNSWACDMDPQQRIHFDNVINSQLSAAERQRIGFLNCDVFNLVQERPDLRKFDLITCAQSLQNLGGEKFIDFALQNLLVQGGAMAFINYFPVSMALEGDSTNQLNQDLGNLYINFYRTIDPNVFMMPQEGQMQSMGYSFQGIDFNKFFNSVSKSSESLLSSAPLASKIKWLRSLSAYTSYRDLNKIDPIDDFEQGVINLVANYRGIPAKSLNSSDIVLSFGHQFHMVIGRQI